MEYKEALDYIHGTYKFGSKLGLDNIRLLMDRLGNPQKNLGIIHVAGTNGKGSTCAMMHSVLVEAGYKVGLYTSPYLEEFNERIRINDRNIENEDLARITGRVREKVNQIVSEGHNHPTEFEIVTAIALCYFKEKEVDMLILEVGMGGRLDATNVIMKSLVSVITPLALDHTQYLGETIAEIAVEKGGIIKEGGLVVSAEQEPDAEEALRCICKERNADISIAGINDFRMLGRNLEAYEFEASAFGIASRFRIRLLGEHQVRNCMLAVRVLELLASRGKIKLDRDVLLKGLEKAAWPGRLEVLSKNPDVIIDGAHNAQGASVLRKFLECHFSPEKRDGGKVIGVIGVLGDKDTSAIVRETVTHFDRVIVTEPDNKRAMRSEDLKALVEESHDSVMQVAGLKDAVETALSEAGENDSIIVYGSLYLIGHVRTILLRR